MMGALLIAALALPSPARAGNSAQFVSQEVRRYLDLGLGRGFMVSVTMANTGDTTWTKGAGYKLGAQAPQDNSLWGFNRVELADNESIAPGQLKTFYFAINAPDPGIYNFQWRMVQEWKEWFGDFSPNTPQAVLPPAPGNNFGGGPAPSFSSADRMVMAYHFYWYDITINGSPGSHIVENGQDVDTYHPVNMNNPPFTWRSVAWYENELLGLAASGTDVMLPVYWGFPHPKGYTNEWSNGGLRNLVKAMSNLQARGILLPKIGMFYDTSTLAQNPLSCNPNTNKCAPMNLQWDPHRAFFWGTVRDFFSQIPRDMRARMDGKLIVVLYGANPNGLGAISYDQGAFDFLRQEARLYLGEELYLIPNLDWRGIQTESNYAWGAAYVGPTLFGIAQIGPGFHDWGNQRIRPNGDRNNGMTYIADWNTAMQSGRNIIGIETWNELHEGSGIEPTREFGIQYVVLTNAYSNIWRGKSTDAAYLRQNAPAVMAPGQTATVSVTMKNTGTASWSAQAGYRLGSQNPQDNATWGLGRVELDTYDYIKPGQEKTFTFTITAPQQPGVYDFQWRMVQEWIRWYGEYTPSMKITVKPLVASGSAPGGSSGGATQPAPSGSAGPIPAVAVSPAAAAGTSSVSRSSSIGTAVSPSRIASTAVAVDAIRASDISHDAVSSSRITASEVGLVRTAASPVLSSVVAPTSYGSVTQSYSLDPKAYRRGIYPAQARPQSLRPLQPHNLFKGFGRSNFSVGWLRHFRNLQSVSQSQARTSP